MKDDNMPWSTGVSIFLLTAGFAKLTTVILNRLVARPQPKWVIGITELIQLATIPLYAIALIRLSGHNLWSSNIASASATSFSDDPLVGMLALVGLVGLFQLIYSTIAYHCYRPPLCQIACDAQLVDLRQPPEMHPWQPKHVGPGPMRSIALLPGNQQFLLEVSTKTFVLPRLPAKWDGLSIVQLADTHFRGAVTKAYFEAVCDHAQALQPDLFIFTGDLLDDASLLEWLPQTLGRLKAPLGQYFILGNHDWYLGDSAIRQRFEQLGWIDLAGRTWQLASSGSGPSIILAGDETPWMGHHPDLNPIPEDLFQILLSHTPDNISWARDQGVDLMLAGHTHGGQIRLPLLGPVYSPSRFGCRYASGVFWLQPTLMYVSRGISGRDPVRYQCLPELTKLVLRSSPQTTEL